MDEKEPIDREVERVIPNLAAFLGRWSSRFRPLQAGGREEAAVGRVAGKEGKEPHVAGLFLLRLTPYVAALFFGFSFYYEPVLYLDLPWRGIVSVTGIFKVIGVSGLIGFGTNWVAIKMLFHPRKKRPLLGQGLIPARKDAIVERIADFTGREIVNSSLIEKELHESGFVERYRHFFHENVEDLSRDPDFRKDFSELLTVIIKRGLSIQGVRRILADTVAGLEPSRSGGVGTAVLTLLLSFQNRERLAEKVETMLEHVTLNPEAIEKASAEFLDLLPDRLEGRGEHLEKAMSFLISHFLEIVNVADVVRANLSRFDERRLEELFRQTTSEQLDFIQYLGGLIGMLGGILILFPVEGPAVVGGVLLVLIFLDRILGAMFGGKG